MLTDTWYLFNKYLKISLRTPLWSLFNLVQPLIWLIIFGQLFRTMANLPGFPADSYTAFFLPGVIIMTVLFGSSWSGVSLLREINSGAVDKMLVAPISRVSIVLSRVLHSAVQVLIQGIIIVVIAALLMGSPISNNVGALAAGMLVIVLLGIGFAALSNGFAIVIQREEPLVVLGNLMTLPLMFFSTAMVPRSFMPDWIAHLATINPINYAVEAVRTTVVGPLDIALLVKCTVIVAIFAAVTLGWAVKAFNGLRN